MKRSVNSKGFGYANDLGPSSTEVAARDGDFRWMAGKPDLENGGRPMEYRGGEDSRARTPELPGNLQLASEPPADGVVSKTLETDLTCIHNQATWRDGSAREPAARDAHCDIQVSKNENVVVPEHARAENQHRRQEYPVAPVAGLYDHTRVFAGYPPQLMFPSPYSIPHPLSLYHLQNSSDMTPVADEQVEVERRNARVEDDVIKRNNSQHGSNDDYSRGCHTSKDDMVYSDDSDTFETDERERNVPQTRGKASASVPDAPAESVQQDEMLTSAPDPNVDDSSVSLDAENAASDLYSRGYRLESDEICGGSVRTLAMAAAALSAHVAVMETAKEDRIDISKVDIDVQTGCSAQSSASIPADRILRPAESQSPPADRGYSVDSVEGFGSYRLENDLCCALWIVAKDRLDLLQPVFYSHDKVQKGYLQQSELRELLHNLEPEASERQLDRVDAMIIAEHASMLSGAQGYPPVTLDLLVRSVHGGAAAAARLSTSDGCLSAARLVAQLENAFVESNSLDLIFSSDMLKGCPPSLRRVRLHRAMLQVAPYSLLSRSVLNGADSVRLLIAALDSPGGSHSGTSPADPLASETALLSERLRSLRSELAEVARLQRERVYTHGAQQPAMVQNGTLSEQTTHHEEQVESTELHRHIVEDEPLPKTQSIGNMYGEISAKVQSSLDNAILSTRNQDTQAREHLDRYYKWAHKRRTQILSFWADVDTKRRDYAAKSASRELERSTKVAEKTERKLSNEMEAKEPQGAVLRENLFLEAKTERTSEQSMLSSSLTAVVSDPDRKEAVVRSLRHALVDAGNRATRAKSTVAALAPFAHVSLERMIATDIPENVRIQV